MKRYFKDTLNQLNKDLKKLENFDNDKKSFSKEEMQKLLDEFTNLRLRMNLDLVRPFNAMSVRERLINFRVIFKEIRLSNRIRKLTPRLFSYKK